MYSWKTSLHLDASREKIWNVLVDFAEYQKWNPSAGAATFESEGPLGQGTRVRIAHGSNSTLFTIEEWGPPRLLRLFISKGKTTGSARFHLVKAPNGGTTLEHHYELSPPLWLEPLMLFVGFGVKKELAALKRWVESQA